MFGSWVDAASSIRVLRSAALALMILASVSLTGCGVSVPRLTQVEGTLTLDGKPLANKSLLFTPVGDTPGQGAGGSSDAEGQYTLKAMVPGATRDYAGVAPGRYRVTVFESTFAGDILSGQNGDEPAVALGPGMGGGKSEIPAIYGTEKSPLVLDVPEAGGVIDIQLKSNPG